MTMLEIELKDTPECRFGGKVSDEKWAPVAYVSFERPVWLTSFRSINIIETEAAYALMPLALATHAQNHYISFLEHYKPKASYYVDKFQRTEDFEREFEQNDAQIGESVGILRTLLLLPILLSQW